jgi:hypothetical protein
MRSLFFCTVPRSGTRPLLRVLLLLLLLLCRLLLLVGLLRAVFAHRTTRGRAEQAVMARIMTRHATDGSALRTALGIRRPRNGREGGTQRDHKNLRFHSFPLEVGSRHPSLRRAFAQPVVCGWTLL